MDTNESLLRAILSTVARGAFTTDQVRDIVAPTRNSDKLLISFNLCDGRTPQAEICKRAKVDKSNLSKALSKWVEAGIIFKLGKEEYPFHIFPLPEK